MPSVSRKQHNLTAMVANDPAAAKRVGIPSSVGKEFVKADKGRKFAKGGDMKDSKAMVKKGGVATSLKAHAAMPASKAHAGMKKGGMAYAKGGGIESKGKTKGKMIKMARGGSCK